MNAGRRSLRSTTTPSRSRRSSRVHSLRKACGGDEALRAEIESLLGDDSGLDDALLEPKGPHTARIGQRIGS